jgi:hypothetical protein
VPPKCYCTWLSWHFVGLLADVEQALAADLGFDKEFERFKAAAAQVRQASG